MSLSKQLRTRFHRFPLLGSKKSAPVDYILVQQRADWLTVKKIWPDGTWFMPWGGERTTAAEMDDVTRATLIDLWAYEDLKGTSKLMGMKLDPGKFYANPVPEDWRPSESLYRKMAFKSRYADQVVNHVVGRLSSLNRLRA